MHFVWRMLCLCKKIKAHKNLKLQFRLYSMLISSANVCPNITQHFNLLSDVYGAY